MVNNIGCTQLVIEVVAAFCSFPVDRLLSDKLKNWSFLKAFQPENNNRALRNYLQSAEVGLNPYGHGKAISKEMKDSNTEIGNRSVTIYLSVVLKDLIFGKEGNQSDVDYWNINNLDNVREILNSITIKQKREFTYVADVDYQSAVIELVKRMGSDDDTNNYLYFLSTKIKPAPNSPKKKDK